MSQLLIEIEVRRDVARNAVFYLKVIDVRSGSFCVREVRPDQSAFRNCVTSFAERHSTVQTKEVRWGKLASEKIMVVLDVGVGGCCS